MGERTGQGCCYDCGRKYGDEFGFPDLLVPNDVWGKISPSGGHSGLLCPSCIVRRCALAGIRCEAFWASGPFCLEHDPDWLEDQARAREGPDCTSWQTGYLPSVSIGGNATGTKEGL